MPGDVTLLSGAIDSGDTQAAGTLLPLVYEELRRLAAHKMANEKACQTLPRVQDGRVEYFFFKCQVRRLKGLREQP